MKANELRLGNIIFYVEPDYEDIFIEEYEPIEFVTVLEIEENNLSVKCEDIELYESINEFKPIPITEKWLFKLGFENHFDRVEEINYYCIKDFVIEKDFFCFGYADAIVYDLLRVNSKNPLKYVHQLQNLYHALTGDELYAVTQAGI